MHFFIATILSQGDSTSSSIAHPNETNVQNNADFAASVLWAETYLGVRYNFATAASTEANFSAFIVPQPLNLPRTNAARWLTDIVGLRPSCTWATSNITQPIMVPLNHTGVSEVVGVYLKDMDLDVVVQVMDISMSRMIFCVEISHIVVGPGGGPEDQGNSLTMIVVKSPIPPSVFNHTTLGPPTDGSTVFLAGQCMSGCPTFEYNAVWLNFTGIPTLTIQLPISIITESNTIMEYQLWRVAFLVCKPNAIIETREVRAEGGAQLIVQPLREGKQFTSQGNISPLDATTMLSFALSSITNIGPQNSSSMSSLGSNLQQDFLFGSQQVNAWPDFFVANASNTMIVNASFLPTTNLSEGFAQLLQSASKGAF